jgi:hypothetical protein
MHAHSFYNRHASDYPAPISSSCRGLPLCALQARAHDAVANHDARVGVNEQHAVCARDTSARSPRRSVIQVTRSRPTARCAMRSYSAGHIFALNSGHLAVIGQ